MWGTFNPKFILGNERGGAPTLVLGPPAPATHCPKCLAAFASATDNATGNTGNTGNTGERQAAAAAAAEGPGLRSLRHRSQVRDIVDVHYSTLQYSTPQVTLPRGVGLRCSGYIRPQMRELSRSPVCLHHISHIHAFCRFTHRHSSQPRLLCTWFFFFLPCLALVFPTCLIRFVVGGRGLDAMLLCR